MTIGLDYTPLPLPTTLLELRALMVARQVTYFGLARARTGWVWSTEYLDEGEPRGAYSTSHATVLDAMTDYASWLGAGAEPQGCSASGPSLSSSSASGADGTCAQ